MGGDLGAYAVDIFKQRDIGLKEGWLSGRVDGVYGGECLVRRLLAATDQVDLGRNGVTGECESRSKGDARGAADCEELDRKCFKYSSVEHTKNRSQAGAEGLESGVVCVDALEIHHGCFLIR